MVARRSASHTLSFIVRFFSPQCWINRCADIDCNVSHSPSDALRYSCPVGTYIGDLSLIDQAHRWLPSCHSEIGDRKPISQE